MQCWCGLHGSAFVAPLQAAPTPTPTACLVHRAVASCPVAVALAGAVVITAAMATAVIQAMRQLDSCQLVPDLVQTHGVVNGYSPQALQAEQQCQDV